MTTATTATEWVYISNGGRICCAEHGGSYLRSALERNPDASDITTPLDNWVRFPAGATDPEYPDFAYLCEGC